MRFKLLNFGTLTLTLCLSIYFTLGLNFVLAKKTFHILSNSPDINPFFTFSIPVFFIAAFAFLFAPFVTKHIAKQFFILLILLSCLVNYGAFQFGIIFNQDMMANIFETTSSEAASYLNIKFILYFLLFGIFPSFLLGFSTITYQHWTKELLKKILLMTAAAGTIAIIAMFFYKDYASIARNNPKLQKDIVPTYYISSAFKYFNNRYFTKPIPYQQIGLDAQRLTPNEKEKYLIVVVVGETARAKNYELNGYNRPTNAYTKKIDNLFYFKNTTSCGTATAVSLPCMFSLLGKDGYSLNKAENQDNVVDILVRGGTKAAWIDNNTGCKGVCHGIESFPTISIPKLECVGEECQDDVMLNVMQDKIDSFKGQEGIIFLHLMGSHGPTYYKRYPKTFAQFKPDCQTSDLQSCTDEEIVNSYDNTILFTDYVISKVIEKLRKYDGTYQTALLYMSDHGESLGENGIYLHGMPYDIAPREQTHIPFMMWLSDEMVNHKQLDVDCLRSKAESGSFSHDNLPHTLLNLVDVKTTLYQNSKDVLYNCIKQHKD
jgi:lipid A ethanolaminephosphotransferase